MLVWWGVWTYDKGDAREEYHWNYWFPHQLYQIVFVRLFPWANFEPDELFLEGEEEYSLSESDIDDINYKRLLMGYGVLPSSNKSGRVSTIKGILRTGEVAFYKLYLTVNEFGEAFYLANQELMEINPYKGLIISKELKTR